jgi:hypothetical protein
MPKAVRSGIQRMGEHEWTGQACIPAGLGISWGDQPGERLFIRPPVSRKPMRNHRRLDLCHLGDGAHQQLLGTPTRKLHSEYERTSRFEELHTTTLRLRGFYT